MSEGTYICGHAVSKTAFIIEEKDDVITTTCRYCGRQNSSQKVEIND